MGTISSRSPAMAYANGGLWMSTFDEMGRRCWVNNLTGERTYAFVGGSPVSPVGDPMISPYYNMQTSPAPWGYGMPRPVAIPPPPGFNRVMVPYPEGYMGCGVPPVTPEGNGGLFHRMQKYYIRSSSEPRSWMWR